MPFLKRELSIWSFVGFILILYGLILAGAGVYYCFYPQVQVGLSNLNPSLWWGIFLFLVGLVFNWADLRASKKTHH